MPSRQSSYKNLQMENKALRDYKEASVELVDEFTRRLTERNEQIRTLRMWNLALSIACILVSTALIFLSF